MVGIWLFFVCFLRQTFVLKYLLQLYNNRVKRQTLGIENVKRQKPLNILIKYSNGEIKENKINELKSIIEKIIVKIPKVPSDSKGKSDKKVNPPHIFVSGEASSLFD